ncbi:hypothetical protein CWE21_09655 [Pseudidiomarina aquimaris]|uniref:Transposase IS30-like HTH domain-containing protein n=1 Tax=Pseudidiomarina aquimaris TaxID=641841 RepID=A0A432XDV9_9GAMM|nr:hypothetical protein CWE21_09655 [Pseudidiomarina aquimaris]
MREGSSFREIGRRLNVSHSTISLEVMRNTLHHNQYPPEVAHAKAVGRKCLVVPSLHQF